jgi:hypothetical protein
LITSSDIPDRRKAASPETIFAAPGLEIPNEAIKCTVTVTERILRVRWNWKEQTQDY